MIAADVLERLKGFSLSKRDRELIYVALIVCTLVIVCVIGLIVPLLWKGKDVTALKDIAANLIWADVALVIAFVAGAAEQRRSAIKAMTQQPPAGGDTP